MNLENFLRLNGKADTWLNIANQFGLQGTNKQKSDRVRRLYNKINTEHKIHIVIGCVHVPFHNKVLFEKLLLFIQDNKEQIGGFHIAGDFLDLNSLSSHNKDTVYQGLKLGEEYAEGNKVLDMLDKVLPQNCQKTFIYGNHEDRYFRLKTSTLYANHFDAVASPHEALRLNERKYQVLTSWKNDYVEIGKYQVFHGQFTNTNPAKSHATKSKTSCVFFHTHRIDQYYEKNIHGLNGGCFIDKNASIFNYASRYEKELWQNGFVVINVDKNMSDAQLITCHNNTFFFGGKKY